MTAPFQVKTIPGPTPEERAAKQRAADRMLARARRSYRLNADERRSTRRYLREIAAKGGKPWWALRSGFRAHLAVSPLALGTYCFHKASETTTGEPRAPLGVCRTCLRRWNRAVADAKAMHVPYEVEWLDGRAVDGKDTLRHDDREHGSFTACRGCYAASGLPTDITAAVKDGFDTALIPAWPCAHIDETDPLAGQDDPKTWRALVEDRDAAKAAKKARKTSSHEH